MKRAVTITKADGSKIAGTITKIDWEGEDNGYPYFTAYIKAEDGKKYFVGLGGMPFANVPEEVVEEDPGEEWLFPNDDGKFEMVEVDPFPED